MKKRKASANSEPGPRLHRVNLYLEKNFPDFFAEARFHVGNDDYFLYSRFGQYLARSIESNRALPRKDLPRIYRPEQDGPRVRQGPGGAPHAGHRPLEQLGRQP